MVELTPSHKYMILASDGVWEFISSKEAVDIVAKSQSSDEACEQVRARRAGMAGIASSLAGSAPVHAWRFAGQPAFFYSVWVKVAQGREVAESW